MKSSSPSSSRTKNSCDGHTPTSRHENPNKNLVIIGLPLSTLNPSSLLFFKPTPTPTPHHTTKPILNLQRIVTESAHVLIGNLHGSIDRCLSFLQLLASNNPLFNTLHSASSAYRSFCQMNRRRQRGSSPLSNHDFAAILPGDSMAGLVVSNGISNFLNIYNTLLVVRLVLTWFPNSPPVIVTPLRRMEHDGISRGYSRKRSSSGKLLAISLGLVAVVSPVFVDRQSQDPDELEPEVEAFLGVSTVLLLLVLVLVVAVSCYVDHSLTRFDPYWIYRVGGSSGGIVMVLIVLALVLKCKSMGV